MQFKESVFRALLGGVIPVIVETQIAQIQNREP